jgi:hypothetical protein
MKSCGPMRFLLRVSLIILTTLILAGTSSAQNRGYDFSERTYQSVTGGDFYFAQTSFFANNIGQRGVVSVGTCSSLDSVTIPTTGYTRFGVPAVAGRCYVALTHNDERNHIVFRADEVGSGSVSMTWKIIVSKNSGATLSATDSTRRGYDFSDRAYRGVTGGDLYFAQNSFFANNLGQRGVISVGACSSIDSVSIPTTGYTRFGVPVVVGQCYVALTHNDERNHIIFRADELNAGNVSITWRIITSGNSGATLVSSD